MFIHHHYDCKQHYTSCVLHFKEGFHNIGSVCWPYNISWLQHLPMKIFVGKFQFSIVYNKNNIEMYALAPVALHCKPEMIHQLLVLSVCECHRHFRLRV